MEQGERCLERGTGDAPDYEIDRVRVLLAQPEIK